MSDLTEMWAALERYQPYADKAGHGDSWRRMTTERTADATWIAWAGASKKDGRAAKTAMDVWSAIVESEHKATRITEHINHAMEVQP